MLRNFATACVLMLFVYFLGAWTQPKLIADYAIVGGFMGVFFLLASILEVIERGWDPMNRRWRK